MREFVKDYIALCRESGKFMKKHWKGVLVSNASVIGIVVAYIAYIQKKDEKELEEFHKEIETLI